MEIHARHGSLDHGVGTDGLAGLVEGAHRKGIGPLCGAGTVPRDGIQPLFLVLEAEGIHQLPVRIIDLDLPADRIPGEVVAERRRGSRPR